MASIILMLIRNELTRTINNKAATNRKLLNYEDYEYVNVSEEVREDLCPTFHLNILHMYYMPVIIFVGLIGNLIAIIVFTTTHLRMRSSSYYLTALSASDFVFVAVLAVVHCSFMNIMDTFNKEGWCQTLVYISSVSSTLSIWLIVAFTVERFIAVQYPFQRPHMCTIARAKNTILILSILAALSQTYVYATAGIIVHEDGVVQCDLIADIKIMTVINFIDTGLTMVGPISLIVVLNALIARNVFKFRKRQQNEKQNEFMMSDRGDRINLTLNRVSNSRSYTMKSNASTSIHNSEENKQCTCPNARPVRVIRSTICRQNQQHVTKMLLISSVFVTFSFPSYVCRVYILAHNLVVVKEKPPAILWCMQQITMLLFYTNFCINFLLYSMCGTTFRKCMFQLIRSKFNMLARIPREERE